MLIWVAKPLKDGYGLMHQKPENMVSSQKHTQDRQSFQPWLLYEVPFNGLLIIRNPFVNFYHIVLYLNKLFLQFVVNYLQTLLRSYHTDYNSCEHLALKTKFTRQTTMFKLTLKLNLISKHLDLDFMNIYYI